MPRKKLAELEQEARRRWPILEAALVHRLGHLEVGEISVAVAVRFPHRHDAFAACRALTLRDSRQPLVACRWLIDALKEVVPIWKKETWADGTEEWVHPGLNPTP